MILPPERPALTVRYYLKMHRFHGDLEMQVAISGFSPIAGTMPALIYTCGADLL